MYNFKIKDGKKKNIHAITRFHNQLLAGVVYSNKTTAKELCQSMLVFALLQDATCRAANNIIYSAHI